MSVELAVPTASVVAAAMATVAVVPVDPGGSVVYAAMGR